MIVTNVLDSHKGLCDSVCQRNHILQVSFFGSVRSSRSHNLYLYLLPKVVESSQSCSDFQADINNSLRAIQLKPKIICLTYENKALKAHIFSIITFWLCQGAQGVTLSVRPSVCPFCAKCSRALNLHLIFNQTS